MAGIFKPSSVGKEGTWTLNGAVGYDGSTGYLLFNGVQESWNTSPRAFYFYNADPTVNYIDITLNQKSRIWFYPSNDYPHYVNQLKIDIWDGSAWVDTMKRTISHTTSDIQWVIGIDSLEKGRYRFSTQGQTYYYSMHAEWYIETLNKEYSFIKDDDKIYKNNGSSWVETDLVEPLTYSNFETSGTSDFTGLFLSKSKAIILMKKEKVLDDGYQFRCNLNIAKYKGINKLIFSTGVFNFGTYKAWSDGTYASSPEEYIRVTDGIHQYNGDIGDGIYRCELKDDTNYFGAWTIYQTAINSEVVDVASKYIKLKSTAWCGSFPAIVFEGQYTLTFEYKGNGTFNIDNDGTDDNMYNKEITANATWQTYTATQTHSISGSIILYLRNNTSTLTEIKNITLKRKSMIVDIYSDMTRDQGGWALVTNTGAKNTLTTMATSSGTLISPTQSTMAKISDGAINMLRGSNLDNSIVKLERPNNPTFKDYNMYFRQNTLYTSNSPRYGTAQDASKTLYTYYTTYNNSVNKINKYGANSTNYGSSLSTWEGGSFPTDTPNAYYYIMNFSTEASISNNTYEGSRSERGTLVWVKKII